MARLPVIALLTLLGLSTSALAQVEPSFDFYPKDAQSCLYQAADKASSCPTSSNQAQNACFCSNEYDFVINAAKCLGNDDAKLLTETYNTMRDACGDSGTTLGVSLNDWEAAAGKSSPSSTTEATATSSNESKTTTAAEKDDGLSTGTTIGIAVGCAVVGAALMAGLGFYLFRRYRRRADPASATPMLPHHDAAGGEGTSPVQSSMYTSSPYHDYQSSSMGGYKSPAIGMEETSRWGTPSAPSELPPHSEAGTAVEMQGSAVPPVEMMGSLPSQSR